MADLIVREAYDRTTVTVDASAITFLTGDLIANDGSGNWVLADADVAARQDCQWIALQTVSAGGSATYPMPVAKRAILEDTDANAYTAGALLYMSATPGRTTATVPTAAIATCLRVVGKAITANIIALNINVPHYYPSIASGANAAHADCGFFIAPRPLRVIEARASWDTAFASGVTLTVAKAASGTDITSGTNVLTSTFALDGTGDTTNILAASTTAATARLATGNVLGIVFSATTTGVGLVVTATLVDEQLI